MTTHTVSNRDPRTKDMTGERHGFLEVKEFAGYRNSKAMWLCLCHGCGNTKPMKADNIKAGNACGCQWGKSSRTHGMKFTPEHKAWVEMKRRCAGKSTGSFRYVDRGIMVCSGLGDSFEWFYSILGERPEGHSIDRIRNAHPEPSQCSYTCGKCAECVAKHYPANVQWATAKEQSRNRRSNRFVTVGDATKTVAEWSEETGIHPTTIRYRLDNGWTPEDAVSVPT